MKQYVKLACGIGLAVAFALFWCAPQVHMHMHMHPFPLPSPPPALAAPRPFRGPASPERGAAVQERPLSERAPRPQHVWPRVCGSLWILWGLPRRIAAWRDPERKALEAEFIALGLYAETDYIRSTPRCLWGCRIPPRQQVSENFWLLQFFWEVMLQFPCSIPFGWYMFCYGPSPLRPANRQYEEEVSTCTRLIMAGPSPHREIFIGYQKFRTIWRVQDNWHSHDWRGSPEWRVPHWKRMVTINEVRRSLLHPPEGVTDNGRVSLAHSERPAPHAAQARFRTDIERYKISQEEYKRRKGLLETLIARNEHKYVEEVERDWIRKEAAVEVKKQEERQKARERAARNAAAIDREKWAQAKAEHEANERYMAEQMRGYRSPLTWPCPLRWRGLRSVPCLARWPTSLPPSQRLGQAC